MFVTDDQTAKQSLLRAIHTGKFEMISPPDDVYWKHGQQSPQTRAKILTETDGVKGSPEMSRLLRMGTDETQQTMSYHSVRELSGIPRSNLFDSEWWPQHHSKPNEPDEQLTDSDDSWKQFPTRTEPIRNHPTKPAVRPNGHTSTWSEWRNSPTRRHDP